MKQFRVNQIAIMLAIMWGGVNNNSFAAMIIGSDSPTTQPSTSITSTGNSIIKRDNIQFKVSAHGSISINAGNNINISGNTLITGGPFKAKSRKQIKFLGNLKVEANNPPGEMTIGEGIYVQNSFFGYQSKWLIRSSLTDITNQSFTVGENWYGTTQNISSLEDIGTTADEQNITITLPQQKWDNGSVNADGSVGSLTGMTMTIGGAAYGYTRIALPNDILLGDILDKNGVTQFSPAVITVEQGSFVSPDNPSRNNFAFYGKSTLQNSNKIVYLQLVPGTNTASNPTAKYAWGWIYDQNQPDKGAYQDDTGAILYTSLLTQEMAMNSISRRHDRVGQSFQKDGNSWVRLLGSHENLKSTQFDSKLYTYGFQVGYDLRKHLTETKENRTGIMGSYQRGIANFYDNFYVELKEGALLPRYKKVATDTIDFFSLGAYHTNDYIWGYTDYIGQLFVAKHSIQSIEKNNHRLYGAGVALSGEIGYNLYQTKKWLLQAQGQAIYQFNYTHLQHNENNISFQRENSLRLRLGGRLEYSGDNKKLWLTADMLRDIKHGKEVTFGQDKLNLKTPHTWGDIGLGLDWITDKNFILYSAIHTEFSFKNRPSKTSLKGNIGIKWKF
ncbi:autotransporter domain-containing protein [Gallibacterium trehalosifermentans]|uniref:Autotransporter domain-containing protein n=1 Tax=Gallibacterium trehalosifermentans TaxID=516935 RepID=A0ABV6H321_9PAST